MRFADIIDNSDAVDALRKMVDSNRIPHAMLISGPSGIGKMQLARAFAAYLNCQNRIDGDSCGVCPACRRIEAGNNPDIHYIYPIVKAKSSQPVSTDFLPQWHQLLKDSPYMDPVAWLSLIDAGNKQPVIYVSDADAIEAKAAVSSYSDPYKIFIIWLPEKLNPAAANKLLKTLEEPFEDTLFICVSNSPQEILPTISSRLRHIEMHRPSMQAICDGLTRKGVSPQTASTISRMADGSLLKAFQMISAAGETEEFAAIFRDAMRMAYARKADSLRTLSERIAAFGREKMMRLLDYFARMTRENFIANLCVPPLNIMSPDEEAFSSRFAPFINYGNVEQMTSEIDAARLDISRNANPKLVWFDFLLRLMILLRMQPKKNTSLPS